jgi:hypothetical protein
MRTEEENMLYGPLLVVCGYDDDDDDNDECVDKIAQDRKKYCEIHLILLNPIFMYAMFYVCVTLSFMDIAKGD